MRVETLRAWEALVNFWLSRTTSQVEIEYLEAVDAAMQAEIAEAEKLDIEHAPGCLCSFPVPDCRRKP